MGIYSNSLSYQRASFGSGLLNAGSSNYFKGHSKYIQIQSAANVHPSTSFPAGYAFGEAIFIPLIGGGISAKLFIDTSTSADVTGRGLIGGSVTISITTSSDADMLENISATLNVHVSSNVDITATGYLSGTCEIGSRPSADDVAQAVLGFKIEGDYSMRDILKILSAVAAGKTSITDLGSGNATVVFRDINDTEARVNASMSGSERNSVSITT